MNVLPTPDLQALREQALRLAESQRVELLSALLDSMRPPRPYGNEAELGEMISGRAEAYHRGEMKTIDLDESVKLTREALPN